MGKSLEGAHQPAVSYLMFRLSGAHTLEQFRIKVAETLACDPYKFSLAQLQKGGWLVTYAIEEAIMRESRSDIDICTAWLEAMLQIASSKRLEGSGITPRLIQRAGQLLKVRSEAEMLLHKATQLKESGQAGAAIATFSRAQTRTKAPLQMSEHRARAYADTLLDDCKKMLISDRNSQTFCDSLAAYLSLSLFKSTRMHWNFLAIACEGQGRGWIDIAEFLPAWRPERLQIGRSHIAEARAALSKVEEILPTVSFRDRDYLEAFLLEAKLAPCGEPLKDTRPAGEASARSP
jgi:hypothetical protein